jgi:MinD-like ATPase involved in chromosome partitioning or flagellar assembly/CheY-like chemotaxis protein
VSVRIGIETSGRSSDWFLLNHSGVWRIYDEGFHVQKTVTILLIEDSPAYAKLVKQWLSLRADISVALEWSDSLRTGLGRLKQGGIDVILLDLGLPDSEGLETFTRTKLEAFGVPVILLSGDHGDDLALQMVKDGAQDYIVKGACNGELLAKAIRYAMARNNGRQHNGETISFVGAKGGVGTTTVALNAASVMAKRGKAILVELRPVFGTLLSYLKPDKQVRNISHLLRADAPEFDTAEVSDCLWSCKSVPGLSVLFGPQGATECGDLAPDRVKKLIKVLARMADHVVLDLPASLSDANRAAIQSSGRLVVVVEWDPVCVQLANLMAGTIAAWEGTPRSIQSVLVNRASVSCPMPLSEIETQLGYELLGVVPPGSDVCLAAQTAHKPVIALQPDGVMADNLISLTEKCVSASRTLPVMA